MTERWAESLKKWKKKLTRENMAVAALLGLLLMVIAVPVDSCSVGRQVQNAGEESSSAQEGKAGRGASGADAASADEALEEAGYAEKMERQLEELLSSMEGVGETKVMLTVRAWEQQVVEKDIPAESERVSETDSAGGTRESESARQEESTVYVTDSEGNRTPYVSQTIQPQIEGVTVVAQGGGDVLIQKNITEVIQALFDIEAHKIKVVKMK